VTKKKPTFEEALARLEEIVSQLENGEITLEASMQAFEEGKELVKLCLQKLDLAENKIKKLVKEENGEFRLADL